MKIGKTRNKSGLFKVLLGLAVAGALLFASCQDIFDTSGQTPKEDGYGYVIVDLGDSARTTRPDIETLTKFEYIFTGVNVTLGANNNNTLVYYSDAAAGTPFRLPAGRYKLDVNAYTAANAGSPGVAGAFVSATGKYSEGGGEFEVVPNPLQSTIVLKVVLTPKENLDSSDSDAGKLTIIITVPNNATAIYELKQISGAGTTLYSYSFSNPISGNSFPTISNAKFHAGTYLFTGRISTADAKYAGFSEAIHIVDGMLTSFTRDYTAADADLLAAVNNKAEAIALLEADLKSWIGTTPKSPLTTVSGQDQVTVAGSKTTFNYVASNLQTSGSFPLALLGGWAVDPDTTAFPDYTGTGTASAWDVGGSNGVSKFRLVNSSVKANANAANTAKPGSVPTIGPNEFVEYFVELVPVAEYSLSFGSTVLAGETASRSVTITPPEGAVILTAPADIGGDPKKFIGSVAGTTTITINNAAITIRKDDEVKGTPFAEGSTFTPASSRYEINVYQDKKSQVSAAFARLQRELNSKITGNSYAPWVADDSGAYSPYKALTRSPSNETASATLFLGAGPGAPEFTASAQVNKDYGDWDTVTLYYVASRLSASPEDTDLFTVNVPITDDGRWDASGDWNQSITTGGSKTIYYVPFGGERVPYTINYKPVAEVYVSFAESTFGGGAGVYSYPTSSQLLLEDQSGVPNATNKKSKTFKETDGTSGNFDKIGAATDPYNGFKFVLGPTDFTLTDVTIMIDNAVQSTTFAYANFDFFTTKGPIAQNDTGNNDFPANNAAIAQGGTGTNKIAVNLANSREYHINVYRTIAKQISDAQAEMKLETSAAKWGAADASNTAIYSYVADGNTISLAPPATTGSGNATITSRVVYAGTAPTIVVRNDSASNPPGLNFTVSGKGWTALTALPPDNNTGAKIIPLSFTPKGGLEDNNSDAGQYRIELVPALRYKITFMDYPIGTDTLTGSFTVSGREIGNAAAIATPRPHDRTDNGTTKFIGVGDLTVKADGTPPNVVLVSTTGVTGTGTDLDYISVDSSGVMTVTAPAFVNGAIANASATYAPIEIKVYPSIAKQKDNFLANMKAINSTTFVPWTSAPTLDSAVSFVVDTTPAASDTDKNTVVRIVSNVNGVTKIPLIAGNNGNTLPVNFLNTGYPLSLTLASTPTSMGTIVADNTNPTSGSDAEKLLAYGNRDIPVEFTAVCASPDTAANKETYKFKLLAVAEFRFQLMNLPTTALTPTSGSYGIDVQVKAYKPGTDGTGRPASAGSPYPDEQFINITQNTTQLTKHYRGVGLFADPSNPANLGNDEASAGAVRLISRYNNGRNVFSLDGAGVTIDDTTVSGATVSATTSTVVSKVYNVRIYPSVPEQVADVRKTLNGLAGRPAAGWFTFTSGTAGTLITPNFAAGSATGDSNTLEVQYMALTPPTFNAVPSGIILATNTGENGYAYAFTVNPYNTTASNAPQTATIAFTPTGPTSVVPSPAFTIRVIPVTKYKVTYMNGATGTVIITPPTGIVPGTQLTINADPTLPKDGYRGLSINTTIQISSTAGAYDEVQIRKTSSVVSPTVIVEKEPTGGGFAPAVPYQHSTATSEEWEIVVIKK